MSLTTHKIDSSHHPTVDLFLDGKSIVTIGIEAGGRPEYRRGVGRGTARAADGDQIRQLRGQRIAGGAADRDHEEAAQVRPTGAIRLHPGMPVLEPGPSTGPVEQVEVPDTKAPSTRGDWYSDPTRRYQFRWWDG